ncbi:MAG: LysE family translocator [Alphaproteobacteria bacterium]|nr:MAG: LysE family translocator [Alphaproteobacteria bacterium]
MDYAKISLITLFAVSMVGSPGPANMALMAAGASFGYVRSLPFLIGTISGFLAVCAATALGLGTLFTAFPAVQIIFLAFSMLYIFYLAYKVATANPSLKDEAERPGFFTGAILHPLNPKAWVTIVAAYSQFISPEGSYTGQVLTIILIFMIVGFPLNSVWCYGGNILRRLVSNPRAIRIINGTLATLMLIAVGLTLWETDMLAPLAAFLG